MLVKEKIVYMDHMLMLLTNNDRTLNHVNCESVINQKITIKTVYMKALKFSYM